MNIIKNIPAKKLQEALRLIVLLFTFNFLHLAVSAQNDSMLYLNQDSPLIKTDPQTPSSLTFTDARDGKVYQTVQIGNQTWMAENLAYLPSVVGSGKGSLKNPLYYVIGYNGTDTANAKATASYKTYGVLYNWPAAVHGAVKGTDNLIGVQGVCPDGWHLPSDEEWTTMENYLIENKYNYDGTSTVNRIYDGTSTVNRIAKALATASGWSFYSGVGCVGNTDLPSKRNSTGFSALPGGYRFDDGSFYNAGSRSGWWSATSNGGTYAWCRSVSFDLTDLFRFSSFKDFGFSVRCVKD